MYSYTFYRFRLQAFKLASFTLRPDLTTNRVDDTVFRHYARYLKQVEIKIFVFNCVHLHRSPSFFRANLDRTLTTVVFILEQIQKQNLFSLTGYSIPMLFTK